MARARAASSASVLMDLIFQGHEYLFALLDVDGSRHGGSQVRVAV